jgi:hypothetical protein
VSLKKKLAQALVSGVLVLGAVCGVPMEPEKILRLMNINKRAITRVIRQDDDKDK